jgi:signal transduction histidine kinase
MSIKAKLLLATLSEVLLIVVFSVFLVVSSQQISRISTNEAKATKIVESITQIRFVTFENLLHHNERSYNQWQAKHKELGALLENYPVSGPVEKSYIDNITQQHETVGPIFDKLIASYSQPSTNPTIITQNEYQERLASQLISKQQIEISEAFKLSKLKREQSVMIRQQTSSLAVAIIILMFLITAVNFVFVFASISRALAILQVGAREISKGHLGYRIKYKRSGDEFGLLASTFNHMAKNLEQLDKVKSEFVLLVSHQLRTPATAVKGFISLFQDHYADNLSSKQHDLLQSAYEENERQIKLVNEILAVAQLDTREIIIDKKPANLVEIVESVIEEQKLVLDSRGQKVVFDSRHNVPPVSIDSEKIRIVIENLVHNASKFSPPNTTITVSLKVTGPVILVAVKDQGLGIEQHDLDKLFKKFSHVSNPDTVATEGAGLGLYLAKRIIELHHGKIAATSTVGKGTIFTVQLPISN